MTIHIQLFVVTSNLLARFFYFCLFVYIVKLQPVNATAVYPYKSKSQGSLTFEAGDIITLLGAR